jgi:cobalt/nickel transport system permease protein
LFFGILLAASAHLPVAALGKRMFTVNIFVLLLWVTLPLSAGGQEITEFGPLALSSKGIALALLVTLKSNGIVLILTALAGTSSIPAIGHGLERLRLPHKFILLLLTTYRYLGVIEQEYTRLQRSAELRCFSASTNLHTYRTYGYLIGMTLIHSYNSSKRIHQAMLMRGFQGKFPLLELQTTRSADLVLLAFFVLSSMLLALGPVFFL